MFSDCALLGEFFGCWVVHVRVWWVGNARLGVVGCRLGVVVSRGWGLVGRSVSNGGPV